MRKLFLILGVAFLATSCADDVVIDTENDATHQIQTFLPQSRSAEDAIQIAKYASSLKDSPASRSGNEVEIDGVVSITNSQSRSGIDTLMYVVNYASDNGYAIIPKNRNLEPLIAVTESGHFDSVDEIDNPGLKMYINNVVNTLGVVGPPIIPPEPINPQMQDWIYEEIEDSVLPRLTVAYGTHIDYPKVTCNVIAAAHALSYLEEPDTMMVLELDYNNNYTVPRLMDINWYAFKNLSDPICAYLIGDFWLFMNELSRRMMPDDTGGIYFDVAHDVLSSIIPGKVSQIYSGTPTVTSIKNGGLIIMQGQYYDAAGVLNDVGHTWVIDGYKYKEIIDICYKVTIDRWTGREISRELEYDHSQILTNLAHINWGLAGADNGYFKMSFFKPSSAVQFDEDPGYKGGIYDRNYSYNCYYYYVK